MTLTSILTSFYYCNEKEDIKIKKTLLNTNNKIKTLYKNNVKLQLLTDMLML